MADHMQDEADLEALKRWWDENGKGLVAAVAIKQAKELCAKFNLAGPELVRLRPSGAEPSRKTRSEHDRLFDLMLNAAPSPDLARPVSDEKRAAKRRSRLVKMVLRTSAFIGLVVGGGVLIWALSNRSSSPSSDGAAGGRGGGKASTTD